MNELKNVIEHAPMVYASFKRKKGGRYPKWIEMTGFRSAHYEYRWQKVMIIHHELYWHAN